MRFPHCVDTNFVIRTLCTKLPVAACQPLFRLSTLEIRKFVIPQNARFDHEKMSFSIKIRFCQTKKSVLTRSHRRIDFWLMS